MSSAAVTAFSPGELPRLPRFTVESAPRRHPCPTLLSLLARGTCPDAPPRPLRSCHSAISTCHPAICSSLDTSTPRMHFQILHILQVQSRSHLPSTSSLLPQSARRIYHSTSRLRTHHVIFKNGITSITLDYTTRKDKELALYTQNWLPRSIYWWLHSRCLVNTCLFTDSWGIRAEKHKWCVLALPRFRRNTEAQRVWIIQPIKVKSYSSALSLSK